MNREKQTRVPRQEESLQKWYIQEQELPEALKKEFHIVSCLSWQEEQSVYLLEDKAGRRSVIKRAEEKRKEVLRKEAECLKRIPFSFLPAFLSWQEEDGAGWLQREYIPGDTLWELVERNGPLEAEKAGEILCRLCGIAGQLHRCDPPIIHRYFKPQNIVLTPEGNLFLIDLGTVRAYREGAAHDTQFMGTRQTAAPEQYGYRQTDCRTDIYALGVIYLYLLTGSMELQRPENLSGVPEGCRRIIEKCTRMEPEERYASAEELERAVRETTGGAAEGDAKHAQRRKRKWLLPVLFVAALALLGISGICYYREMPYQFHSELVEEAVRRQLGRTDGQAITKEELAGIESLRICGDYILTENEQHQQHSASHSVDGTEISGSGNISDLTDLVYMKNLRTLVLDRQEITDISPLAALPLESVSLCRNPVTDISALSGMDTLRELYLEETGVQSLEDMAEMTSLRVLRIGNEQPVDLTPVAELPLEELCMVMVAEDSTEILQKLPLKRLRFHSWSMELEEAVGQMTDLEELTIYGYQYDTLLSLLSLTDLRTLDLYGGRLQSVEGIEALAKLTFLGINNTPVQDISPLAALEQLTWLGLDNTEITDFSVLTELKNLQWVRCDEVQRPQIEDMADTLPFTLESVPVTEE